MLERLELRNYLLVDRAEITFKSGLNVIIGETGSGKSVLVGSLGLLAGQRARQNVFRQPEQKVVIEGLWQVSDVSVQEWLRTHELDDMGKEVVLRRELLPSGRHRAFINDTPVNLNLLKELGTRLVHIQTQHALYHLKTPEYALDLVDMYLDQPGLLTQYRQIWHQWQAIRQRLHKLEQERSYLAQTLEREAHWYEALEQAPLEDWIEQNVEERLALLEHAETIGQALHESLNYLVDDDQAAVHQIARAIEALRAVENRLSQTAMWQQRLDQVRIELQDVAEEIRQQVADLVAHPEELAQLQQMAEEINRLLHRYGVTSLEELVQLRNQFREAKQRLEAIEGEIALAQQEAQEIERQLWQVAQQLSEARKKAAHLLEERLNEELTLLNLTYARVRIEHRVLDTPAPQGIDQLTILFSPDRGRTYQPVYEIASGGELARLMLAFQALISQKRSLPTLVLDEIDTGISGETAQRVAQYMRRLGERVQIVAITHLPAVAAAAHHLMVVEKTFDESGQPTTQIRPLEQEEDRIQALAHMMAGERAGERVLAAARQLLQEHQR